MSLLLGYYRALIVSTEINGVANELYTQLTLSPMCSEIFYVGPPISGISSTHLKKLRPVTEVPGRRVDAAFFGGNPLDYPKAVSDLTSDLQIGHVSLFGQAAKAEHLFQHPHTRLVCDRLSLFLPSFVVQNDEISYLAKFNNAFYPIVSQFLPVQFREISAQELALAIRLNAEFCEGPTDKSNSRVVEILRFRECMQVIGRDDKI